MKAKITCTFVSPEDNGYARFSVEPMMPKGAALQADSARLTVLVFYQEAGVSIETDTLKGTVEKCQDYLTGETGIQPIRVEF